MNSVRVINNEFKSFKDDENQPAQKISFNNRALVFVKNNSMFKITYSRNMVFKSS